MHWCRWCQWVGGGARGPGPRSQVRFMHCKRGRGRRQSLHRGTGCAGTTAQGTTSRETEGEGTRLAGMSGYALVVLACPGEDSIKMNGCCYC